MMTTRRRRSPPAARRGLAMTDMVIAVLIIGILSVVAAPKFANMLHRARGAAAAKRIKADLALARQRAVSNSSTMAIQFSTATHHYTIPGLASLDRPGQTYSVKLTTSPYHSELAEVSLGGDAEVRFDRFGRPDSGGTITVHSGGFVETVTIDSSTGRATIP